MEEGQNPPLAATGEMPANRAAHDDGALTKLHPNHVKALRLEAIIISVPLLVAALVVDFATPFRPGVIVVPAFLFLGWLIMFMPWRRFKARGYAMGPDRLRVVRGLLFRKDTVVPFGRVQHIDVNKGPIERYFGLATLIVHTAGTHNASVSLPGLGEDTALAMREAIREKIRQDTL